MAMQGDINVQVRSAKRGLSSGSRGIALTTRLAALGTAGFFAAIVAPVMLAGLPWTPLGSLLPILNSGVGVAIVVFLLITIIWLLIVYVGTALAIAGHAKQNNR